MSIKMSVELRNIFDTDRSTNTQAKYQSIKFLITYCFVFLQKMQPGGLFEVNKATNVFFMILCDCFISENAINLSSAVHRIGLHVYTSLRTGVILRWQKNVSQSKR